MSEYSEHDKFLDYMKALSRIERSKYGRLSRYEKAKEIDSGITYIQNKYKSKIESLLHLPRFFTLKGLETYLRTVDSMRRNYSRCLESIYYFEGLCKLLKDVYERNRDNSKRTKAINREVTRIAIWLDDLIDPNSPDNYFNKILSISYELIEKYKPWLRVRKHV